MTLSDTVNSLYANTPNIVTDIIAFATAEIIVTTFFVNLSPSPGMLYVMLLYTSLQFLLEIFKSVTSLFLTTLQSRRSTSLKYGSDYFRFVSDFSSTQFRVPQKVEQTPVQQHID